MNKQEALEALLWKVRGWEHPHEEVRATHEQAVFGELVAATDDLDINNSNALITIGAAALYLLTTEVTVVEGRTLDEWLASKEDQHPELVGLMRTKEHGTVVHGDMEAGIRALGAAGAQFVQGMGGVLATGLARKHQLPIPTRAPYLPIPLSKDGNPHPEKEGHTDAER